MLRRIRNTRLGRPLALPLDIVHQRTGTNAREACGLLPRGHKIPNKVFLCLQTLLSGKAVQ